MLSLHLKYQLVVTVTEPLQGKMGNGLKVASFFHQ
jgi:hypothetical protein